MKDRVSQQPCRGLGPAPYLHHGLVAPQRQEHAGSQLVFRQGEQEFFGLVTGAHEDVHLGGEISQVKDSDHCGAVACGVCVVCVEGLGNQKMLIRPIPCLRGH